MRPGRAADHSPPSGAEVLEEYSYTSTPLWATTGPVTGLFYLSSQHYKMIILPFRIPSDTDRTATEDTVQALKIFS